MALSANLNVHRYVDQTIRTLAVRAGAVIYRGALVGLDRGTGFVQPLTAADQFQGIAYKECDNAAGFGGDHEVTLFTEGDFDFPLTGAARAHIGRPVFATDDNTLTLSGGSAAYVGTIIGIPAADQVMVRIDPWRRCTHTLVVPLASAAGAATSNPVAAFSTGVVLVKAQVWFETKPDAGHLDVGFDLADPSEVVNHFDLTTLTAHTPSNLTLSSTLVDAGTRLWAKVGAATATAGMGGGLAIEYFPLP